MAITTFNGPVASQNGFIENSFTTKAIRLNVTKIDADNVITFFVIQANT